MDKQVLTFQDIISFNGNDWDQAYEVLNYHLEKGNIVKEVMQGELVVYHNEAGLQIQDLQHGKIIFTNGVEGESVFRPKRKRIN